MEIILLATNDNELRKSLSLLIPESCLLLHAGNLEEARRILNARPIDIVLVDDFLGSVCASDFLVEILKARRDVPVIVMTAEVDARDTAKCLTLGAHDVIRKQFLREEVVNKVQKTLEYAHLRRNVELLKQAREKAGQGLAKSPSHGTPSTERAIAAEALEKFHKALVNIRDPENLFALITESIADIFSVSNVVLVVQEKNPERLSLGACTGAEEDFLRRLVFNPNEGIVLWLRRNRRILLIEGIVESTSTEHSAEIRKEAELLRARICVPLESDGRLVGFLSLGNRITGRPFAESELMSMFRLAGYAANAIENALSFRELRSQRTEYAGILRNLGMGIIAADAEAKIIAINETAAALLGLNAAHLTGQPVQKLGSAFADVFLQILKKIRTHYQKGIPHPLTGTPLEVSASVLRNGEGHDAGAVMILSQTSAPTPVRDACPEPHSEPWDHGRRNLLLARMSDYIGNTLVPIYAYAGDPQKKEDPKLDKQVKHPAKELSKIIDKLADFADSCKASLREGDIEQFLAEFVKRKKTELETVKIQFLSNLSNKKAVFDQWKLAKALENVIQNSLESFKEDQKTREIGILAQDSLDRENNGQNSIIEISITDNGRGIAEEDIEKAWEPFYSSNKGSKRMGLGLSMARTIIEKHNGSIKIESKRGKGTTVRIRLPAAKESVSHAQ